MCFIIILIMFAMLGLLVMALEYALVALVIGGLAFLVYIIFIALDVDNKKENGE